MSGSLTVIGGHSSTVSLSGLVTIPTDQSPLTIGLLQAALDSISGAVSTGSASLINIDSIGGATVTAAGSTFGSGLYEITNTDSTGATTAGSISDSFTVPDGYSTLVVQAPGSETIDGNGSTNFLAVFGAQSSVSFFAVSDGNVASGTGTVVASADNFIDVGGTYGNGQGWTVLGAATGGDTINTTAENAAITTQGSGNVVGLAGIFSTVVAGGSGDLIAGYGGNNIISVTGSGDNVLISGGADTVYATSGTTGLDMFFFGSGGGTLDFINQSSVSASVTGGSNGAAGSVTVFGGTGGGYYQGGTSGNNSLIGGSGTSATTLIGGSGANNFLSVGGSGNNALFADDGSATLVASSSTDNNELSGGLGTDSIISFGSGQQNFFVGNSGSETITGSSVGGALNTYYFQQSAAEGGGTDVITNFRYGTDQVYINPFDSDSVNGFVAVSTIQGATIDGKASSTLTLTDNTTIKLVGVTFTASQQASIIGSTHF